MNMNMWNCLPCGFIYIYPNIKAIRMVFFIQYLLYFIYHYPASHLF